MSKNTKINLDEIGEKVRRARAIALLTQVAAGQRCDYSHSTHLAMCVVEELLDDAETMIDASGVA